MPVRYVINDGLRQVSASSGGLALLMENGDAVQLTRGEVVRMLAEVASVAPELLHGALEQRLVSLIAAEVRSGCEEEG